MLNEEITFIPDLSKGFESCVDTNLTGEFDKYSANDPYLCCSRIGFVIDYEGCPAILKFNLQVETVFSATEAEHIILLTSLRENMPLLERLK